MESLEPKMFYMIREADESGVSGTGHVLDGVLWHSGWVTVCWRSDINVNTFTSIGVYPSWEAFSRIHIESHPTNETKVVWKE